MIDIHCHMLPGLDDGPKTLTEALQMAEFARDQGISRVMLTPHIQPGCYDNNQDSIQHAYRQFKTALQQHGIALQVGMAAEIRVCAELPQMIMQNQIPFLGNWQDKKVILLEFPHETVPIGAEQLVKWLLARDILPMIAHPERNQGLLRHPEKLAPFVKLGCLLQVTASSITGLFGNACQQYALRLIQANWVTAIASDAHNMHKRLPTFAGVTECLEPLIGQSVCQQLLHDNPLRLIQNHPQC